MVVVALGLTFFPWVRWSLIWTIIYCTVMRGIFTGFDELELHLHSSIFQADGDTDGDTDMRGGGYDNTTSTSNTATHASDSAANKDKEHEN